MNVFFTKYPFFWRGVGVASDFFYSGSKSKIYFFWGGGMGVVGLSDFFFTKSP